MTRWILIALLLGLTGISCAVRALHHDEHAAAQEAERFTRTLFVSQDYDAAYDQLEPQTKKKVDKERFRQVTSAMHSKSFPQQVSAVEFEPRPGQASLWIYLQGNSGKEVFYYRCLMVGDQPSGYRVSHITRNQGPYPPSGLRRPL